MVLALILGGAIWFGGRALGLPAKARVLLLALLYVALLAVNVALPAGHPLREAAGGSAGEWLLVGGLAVAAWGYWQGIGRLRGMVRDENRPQATAASRDVRLERSARHIVLREIGGPGQARLEKAKVLVVGAGGLGAPALQYLGAAGVGTLGVIDDDTVENSNLQRQVIHTDARIGMPKVFSAEQAIGAQNPFVEVRPYHRRLDAEIARDLIRDYDLVLDGTDDAATRYLVNEACVAEGVPLISGAISQWEGQVSLFDAARGLPCYACLFPEPAAAGLAPSCAEGGVLGPLPGVVGSIMACEAVKHLAGAGETLGGRMLIYDALYAECRIVKVARRPECKICGT